MSGTRIDLRYSVTMADPDRWDPAEHQRIDLAGCNWYDEYVIWQLDDIAIGAIRAYMAEHPTLFAGDVT